jgi:hypothetical protein
VAHSRLNFFAGCRDSLAQRCPRQSSFSKIPDYLVGDRQLRNSPPLRPRTVLSCVAMWPRTLLVLIHLIYSSHCLPAATNAALTATSAAATSSARPPTPPGPEYLEYFMAISLAAARFDRHVCQTLANSARAWECRVRCFASWTATGTCLCTLVADFRVFSRHRCGCVPEELEECSSQHAQVGGYNSTTVKSGDDRALTGVRV